MGVRKNCVIAKDHPYRKLLKKHRVTDDDALWTLGAIAFGAESPWIVFDQIIWDDNTKDFPERINKEWLLSLMPK
ncbi:hypothetical protein ACFL6Y_05615 [Elusimicrobiota bacterium]